jgi:hypothetical protein
MSIFARSYNAVKGIERAVSLDTETWKLWLRINPHCACHHLDPPCSHKATEREFSVLGVNPYRLEEFIYNFIDKLDFETEIDEFSFNRNLSDFFGD